ncbi:polysaccharide pyruvyl transferase family protein [uncultured Bacteroides sp.]|uniref:polysaccharide pyruvyl transferase family protein n=1 Tax=uncultured Bacteroides sp. TaxID=162156 RepID=UPI0026753C5B|nr:polysaccharide pyruvyl transferase family protein [uncultured Bacteroides sp.]
MRIGILTFHWATNYGAVLQSYALQTYLEKKGYAVDIINYQPKKYDNTIKRRFRTLRSFLHFCFNFRKELLDIKKECALKQFRMKYLNLTPRFYTQEELVQSANDYDILISGSDQVLNPAYVLYGEKGITSTYFLNYATHPKKIGYAVSFGCITYPSDALTFAEKWIQSFDKIGVRESTGIDILGQLHFMKEYQVVPDPTVLLGSKMFEKLSLKIINKKQTYVYMLHDRKVVTGYQPVNNEPIVYAEYNSDDISMEKWLESIASSSHFITNSYHGMIMALLFHVPFVVLLESGKAMGMNDRFTTLLSRLDLSNRISENTVEHITKTFEYGIDWLTVDQFMFEYRKVGENFLKFNLNL